MGLDDVTYGPADAGTSSSSDGASPSGQDAPSSSVDGDAQARDAQRIADAEPFFLSLDGVHAYWAEGHAVRRVELGGENPTTLWDTQDAGPDLDFRPEAVLLSATFVLAPSRATNGAVKLLYLDKRAPAGTPRGEVDMQPGFQPRRFAVDAPRDTLYYLVEIGYAITPPANNSVPSIAVWNGANVALGGGRLYAFGASDAGSGLWWCPLPCAGSQRVDPNGPLSARVPVDLAAGGSSVYLADGTKLYVIWQNGGLDFTVSDRLDSLSRVVADDTHVYFSTGPTIWRAPHLVVPDGGQPDDASVQPASIFATAAARPTALALGPQHVAWSAAGAIWIAPK